MKLIYLAMLLVPLCGCAMTRPHVVEIATGTNGVITRKEIWLPAFVIWPGTQTLAKQRASIGKTLSTGFTDAQQDSGSTNILAVLQAINAILSKVP